MNTNAHPRAGPMAATLWNPSKYSTNAQIGQGRTTTIGARGRGAG